MRNMASRVAIMYLGKICEVAPTVEFFQTPLHPYTRMLLSSIPVVSEEEEELIPKRVLSRGEIPSPVNVPSGCSFHLRCPEKIAICSEIDPVMRVVEEDHLVRCHLFNDYREAT
jgi:peptide/nickel transport system ATP-binding protein